MAGSFTLPTVLANLTAGNQALSLVDGDFNAVANPLLALGTFGNYYVDSGSANSYAITVSAPQTVALAAGLPIQFKAGNANTGASTLQINALAAKNILNANGTALAPGQIPASAIVSVMYDGTSFYLISSSAKGISLATEQASTSGTSIDFTGLPAGVRRITVMLNEISTNGTSGLLIQIGDSGGIETSNYVGTTSSSAAMSTGFMVNASLAAAATYTGVFTLTLENAAAFTWFCAGQLARTDGTPGWFASIGRKSTSSELDRVRITMINGTDAFDAGAINISYE